MKFTLRQELVLATGSLGLVLLVVFYVALARVLI